MTKLASWEVKTVGQYSDIAKRLRFLLMSSLTAFTGGAALAEDGRAAGASIDEWVRNNPPSRVEAQAHPVPKDNAHPKVSPEEREAIGLPAPVWTAEGKVHPAVSAALEEQRRLIQKEQGMSAFQGDRPVGFEGTAYVDVYLRHTARGDFVSAENQATIQKAQERLLSSLTAAEFSLIFAFKNTAGMVGYVNEAGLAKLSSDPSVVAIGLDDQPRPADPPIVPAEPRRADDPERWTLAKGKIDPQVIAALAKDPDGYAFVIIALVHAPPGKDPQERQQRVTVQDRVLSALSAGEFRLRIRGFSTGLIGFLNAAGLEKLESHPDVLGVEAGSLDRPLKKVGRQPADK